MTGGRRASVLCGHMLVVGLAGTELTPAERRAISEGRRGGVVLFRRNVTTMRAVALLNAAVRDAAPPDSPPLIAVDQEGGRVKRLGPPALALPPMREIGALADVDLATRLAEAQGRELRALGFTMSFAPVADVHSREENPIIGDRAFSSDPAEVARFASAWAAGLSRAGILTCAKHFPGHGDTTVDSHLALPRVDKSRSDLDAIELAPFRALARDQAIDSMMTAHVVYSAIDAERPATMVPAISTDLLRTTFGFEGVLFSDDLEMKAIALPAGEAAIAAVLAGCDVLLVCSREDMAEDVHAALVREAERSPAFLARCEAAAARSLAMRKRSVPAPVTDEAALATAFEASRTIAGELASRLSLRLSSRVGAEP